MAAPGRNVNFPGHSGGLEAAALSRKSCGLVKYCRYQLKQPKAAEEQQLKCQRDKLKWELFFRVVPALVEKGSILLECACLLGM